MFTLVNISQALILVGIQTLLKLFKVYTGQTKRSLNHPHWGPMLTTENALGRRRRRRRRRKRRRISWLVVLGFNATKVISRRSVTQCVSWLYHTSTNTTFLPNPPTTFFTCFRRGERRKYARKKSSP